MSALDVVIVTYRSAGQLAGCLASIPDRPDVRVIVVDNASGDDGPEIARGAGATVIENGDNRGFAAAANQGVAAGAGAAVLLLNPDARLRPGALDAMLGRLDDPSVGIVGATLVHPDGSPQRSRWPYPSPGQMWAEAFGRRVDDADGFVVGACLLTRRVVWDRLGGFDEAYWLYGEECDLCARAEQDGWRVVLATDAVVEHEGGASGRESSALVAEHFARGADRFVRTHHGAAALVSYRLAGLVASLLRWPLLRVRHPGDPRLAVRSRQIRRTAGVLVRHPTGLVEDPPRDGSTLVVCSLEAWDDVWRRNQFFVRELLARDPHLRVLWVEPAHDVVHAMVRERRLVRPPSRRLRPVPGQPRVLRFRPWKVLPRVVWPGVDTSLAQQVQRAAARARFARPALWVNDAAYLPLVQAVDWPATYDVTDDWLDAAQAPRHRRRLERQEAELLDIVDEVVVCSPELARRKGTRRPVHLIPNGVDVTHLRRPQPRPADLPPSPVAVYVGTLHEDRIDVDLVVELASARPDLAVVFVGPNCLGPVSTRRLEAMANVTLLGPRPYVAVPGYLQHADVVIVPHVVSAFTESLDPIKAYECLAVGTVTVATPVAGFRDLGAPVHVADRVGFVATVAEVLATRPPRCPVDVPGWDVRAAAFGDVLTGRAPLPVEGRRYSVVFLGHTALASGGELALVRLLPGLVHTDAHVILGEDGPLVAKLTEAGATVEVLPMADEARTVKRDRVVPGRLPVRALWHTARYVWRLRRRLRELRPDVVHTNTLKAAMYGGVAARLAGVPVIWHVRDRIADDYLPAVTVRLIHLLARRIPTAIITNSNATRATIGTTSRTVAVAPSPVVYDPVSQPEVPSLVGGELVIGIVGRLAPWKGQDVFLRAFAQAFPERGARAVIVGGALFGEDDFAASLRALCHELGLDDRVEFTGHVDDVPARLAQMHVVVHASVIPEPFGQVVVEAMAAGRAVVAAAAGGPLEVVRNGEDGLLVPPGDVSALAGALRRLADEPELAERLGRAARGRVVEFSPERIGVQVERVYRRVVRR